MYSIGERKKREEEERGMEREEGGRKQNLHGTTPAHQIENPAPPPQTPNSHVAKERAADTSRRSPQIKWLSCCAYGHILLLKKAVI